MYDDEGNVLVTETAEEFEAAARPDVDPDLQKHFGGWVDLPGELKIGHVHAEFHGSRTVGVDRRLMALVTENRWEAKPRTALALKLVIHLLPFVVSVLAVRTTRTMIRDVAPGLPWLLTSLISVLVAGGVLVMSGRIMRRLLPLALLLKLSLLFPDQVPSRMGVALRAASPRRLARQLESADADDASVAERVLALVSALAAHDRRTRGHSERVRALTMLIADKMGIVGEDRDKLEWAALLHDLGKLDVPPEILNKKGRPSDEEWAVLRRHPAGGPGYATGLAEWMGPWIHAMDQHHERYDGNGYPNGILAENIMLSGRIVAVSDSFEVMTATRSYKTPMTTQAARTELVACAGTHFDPNVVRSFMAVSVGEIHKALGPTSWLASMPFVGPAAQAIAPTGNRVLLGGSASPALAAAAALTLLTPVPPLSTAQQPSVAAASVDTPSGDTPSVDASQEAPESSPVPPGDTALPEDRNVELPADPELDVREPQEEVEGLVETGLGETVAPIVPALGDDVEAVIVEAVEPLVDAIEESALATPKVEPPLSGAVDPPELPVRFP